MNYTLENIVDAIKSGDKEGLSEASLGRVYQHMTKQGSESFAIISYSSFPSGLFFNPSKNLKTGPNVL